MKKMFNKDSEISLEESKSILKKIIKKEIICLVIVFLVFILNLCNRYISSKLGLLSKNQYTIFILVVILLNILLIIASIYSYININKIKTKFLYYLYKVQDMLNFVSYLASIVLFAFIYICAPTTVSGSSMNNTLDSTDRVFVYSMFYKPKYYDIVIVDVNEHYTKNDETFYVKRVVATEGDEISFVTSNTTYYGALYVNNSFVEDLTLDEYKTLLTDKYSNTCYYDESNKQTVPENFTIVMGDNRNNSRDSRAIGLIHNSDIIGKVYFRYFSKNKSFGFIKSNIKR